MQLNQSISSSPDHIDQDVDEIMIDAPSTEQGPPTPQVSTPRSASRKPTAWFDGKNLAILAAGSGRPQTPENRMIPQISTPHAPGPKTPMSRQSRRELKQGSPTHIPRRISQHNRSDSGVSLNVRQSPAASKDKKDDVEDVFMGTS